MKPPARCTVCRGAFDPPVWEHYDEDARKYVGEVRCHDCHRAYLYQDTQSHVPPATVDTNGDLRET